MTGTRKRPRQLPRGPIQAIIDARESRGMNPGAPRNFGERGQVDAVETSKPVPLGKVTRRSTQSIGQFNHEVRGPLLLELAPGGPERRCVELTVALQSGKGCPRFSVGNK